MEYSVEAFEALQTEVESQGGALLPDTCMPQDVEFTVPPYAAASVQLEVTCGCGYDAQMVTVYDPKLKKRQGGSGFVNACAVCDAMGHWPRYSEAVYEADPRLRPRFDDDQSGMGE